MASYGSNGDMCKKWMNIWFHMYEPIILIFIWAQIYVPTVPSSIRALRIDSGTSTVSVFTRNLWRFPAPSSSGNNEQNLLLRMVKSPVNGCCFFSFLNIIRAI